jgi:hypothetical protein
MFSCSRARSCCAECPEARKSPSGTRSYWSHAQYILSVCHPIGHMRSIFSVSAIYARSTRTEVALGDALLQKAKKAKKAKYAKKPKSKRGFSILRSVVFYVRSDYKFTHDRDWIWSVSYSLSLTSSLSHLRLRTRETYFKNQLRIIIPGNLEVVVRFVALPAAMIKHVKLSRSLAVDKIRYKSLTSGSYTRSARTRQKNESCRIEISCTSCVKFATFESWNVSSRTART